METSSVNLFLSSADRFGSCSFSFKDFTASVYFCSNHGARASASLSPIRRFFPMVSTLWAIPDFHLIKASFRFVQAMAKKYSLEKKSYFRVGSFFNAVYRADLSEISIQSISPICFTICHSSFLFPAMKSITSFPDIKPLSVPSISQSEFRSQRDSRTLHSPFASTRDIDFITCDRL